MDPYSQKLNILVVGSTGQLGSKIVDCCLERANLRVNILYNESCGELCSRVTNAGGKCFKGDLNKPETLKDACKDIHTIISAVEGDDALYLQGQEALLRAAIECQVKRFVPSDFSLDYRAINEDEHPSLRAKLILKKKIADSPVHGLHILCGVFYEKIFEIYGYGIMFYETMDKKISLIAQNDVARFTAAAIAQPDKIGDICVAGDQLSLKEIMNLYNNIKNVKVPVIRIGDLNDLRHGIQKTRDKGDFKRSLLLNYILLMTEGKAILKDINNSQFPEIKPMSFEEFIKSHPELKFGEEGTTTIGKKPTDNIFADLIITGQQQQNIPGK